MLPRERSERDRSKVDFFILDLLPTREFGHVTDVQDTIFNTNSTKRMKLLMAVRQGSPLAYRESNILGYMSILFRNISTLLPSTQNKQSTGV